MMQQLGLWERLPADAPAPLREAKVLDGDGKVSLLNFSANGTGAGSAGLAGAQPPGPRGRA
jgi:hypothetical protein